MPQIKVSDKIYQRLKTVADIEYRTLGGQIEYLLDRSEGVSNVLGVKQASTQIPKVPVYDADFPGRTTKPTA